jgi:hypothetical protein
MTRRIARFPLFLLPFAATLASSWAAAATPRDASETRDAEGAPAPMQFVTQAGAIVGPGLGATLALDARVTSGLYFGAQGGFFSDNRAGYPFVGVRASYRIEAGDTLRIVPTLGVAHVRVLAMDTEELNVTHQTPVSPTAGLELAAQMGHFLVGCDFQVMPVHITREIPNGSGTEVHEETLYPTPIALFLGATF